MKLLNFCGHYIPYDKIVDITTTYNGAIDTHAVKISLMDGSSHASLFKTKKESETRLHEIVMEIEGLPSSFTREQIIECIDNEENLNTPSWQRVLKLING